MITHERSLCARKKVKPALGNYIAMYAGGCTYKSRHLETLWDVSRVRRGTKKKLNNYLDTGNLLWLLPRSPDAVLITESRPPYGALRHFVISSLTALSSSLKREGISERNKAKPPRWLSRVESSPRGQGKHLMTQCLWVEQNTRGDT